ncbi:helix-turn-helix transcriptional regulator [Methylobacterium oryzisoli]|uniref:helix-turn-helix transcriptional regulator n=1 Tax=Methylobacterium oryzisoli TaxID=3385502 RepID=UPI0038917BA7
MSPAVARAARALIRMTQSELAQASGLGLSTIVDYEKERRAVSLEVISAIKLALENAGVEFLPENGGGEGVRRRK